MLLGRKFVDRKTYMLDILLKWTLFQTMQHVLQYNIMFGTKMLKTCVQHSLQHHWRNDMHVEKKNCENTVKQHLEKKTLLHLNMTCMMNYACP